MQFVAREAVSPLQRLEDGLHPWVAFAIMPLFALANAGVAVSASSLGDPIAAAEAAGKIGALTGSVFSAVLGSAVLSFAFRR